MFKHVVADLFQHLMRQRCHQHVQEPCHKGTEKIDPRHDHDCTEEPGEIPAAAVSKRHDEIVDQRPQEQASEHTDDRRSCDAEKDDHEFGAVCAVQITK